jgi:hypothetical protein
MVEFLFDWGDVRANSARSHKETQENIKFPFACGESSTPMHVQLTLCLTGAWYPRPPQSSSMFVYFRSRVKSYSSINGFHFVSQITRLSFRRNHLVTTARATTCPPLFF